MTYGVTAEMSAFFRWIWQKTVALLSLPVPGLINVTFLNLFLGVLLIAFFVRLIRQFFNMSSVDLSIFSDLRFGSSGRSSRNISSSRSDDER